ncbi:MAG: hypothetical protein PF693_05840 [Spirochaetia bacterium]|nr:hypothetical protein [Spirochaetia bacterium]
MKTESSEINTDFSFENNFIKIGRVQRLGIWRELYNPLGVSANSDLFKETIGFSKNYSLYSGGLYGFSMDLEEGTGFSFLFPDNPWLGGNYTISLDPFLIRVFASVSGALKTSSDDWTSTYSIIPETNPIHIGLNTIIKWDNFNIDYLGTLSGSSTYKSGIYNRLFLELYMGKLSIKSYGGITSPYFISTGVKLVEKRYLLSSWIELRPFRYWETTVKAEYSEDHIPVIPVSYIQTSGSTFFKLKYDNSKFIFRTELGQKFDFDNYGTESLENIFDVRLGFYSKLSLFIDYGFSFDFESIIERKIELNFKGNLKKTDVEIVLKHNETIYEPTYENILRFRLDQEFRNGSVFFKLEVGEDFQLEVFSIGFKTNLD